MCGSCHGNDCGERTVLKAYWQLNCCTAQLSQLCSYHYEWGYA
ncbi:hypothetical protein ADIARSV_3299 [Arcticibacter svalbardensis MN12-7]|uniref:Uncharacterized protein n=1 Tax=Arcticibacter svalbardensis MN12-7 TaxID=1150600 RepID=R9GPF1_9SPHI|nr:hypothetical protein ADIARSV_3299 [Arcticibacter svalbardensis MN12-7]